MASWIFYCFVKKKKKLCQRKQAASSRPPMTCQTGPECVPSLADPKLSVIVQLFSILLTESASAASSSLSISISYVAMSIRTWRHWLTCFLLAAPDLSFWAGQLHSQPTWIYMNVAGMRAVPFGWAHVTLGGGVGPSVSIFPSGCCSPSLCDLTKKLGSTMRTKQHHQNWPRHQKPPASLEFDISWAWRGSTSFWHMWMIFQARLSLPLQYPCWWTGTRPAEHADITGLLWISFT